MIRPINKNDIKGLNRLTPIEWNFDYESFLQEFENDDFFYAFALLEQDKIVGTGNVLIKDKIGWLANILVDANFRRKGYGFKITQFLVDFLWTKGCETQLLIATELGEHVYTKIGFKRIGEYLSFETIAPYDYIKSNSIRKLNDTDLNDIHKLDHQANDENRKHLIDRFYKSGFGYFNTTEELLGVYLPDFGRGLVLSIDNSAGIELLKLKHSKVGKRTMVPLENKESIQFLERGGFKKGEGCSRMILGQENKWEPELIYSYGSGYCG